MKKKSKLTLNRETVRTLNDFALSRVLGGSLRICNDYDPTDPHYTKQAQSCVDCGPCADTELVSGCLGPFTQACLG